MTGDLVFIRSAGDVSVNVAPSDPAPDRDAIFWQSIENSDDPRMFQAYLDQFPEGTFRALAELRLATLSGETPTIREPVPDPGEVTTPADQAIGSPGAICDDLSGTWNNQATGDAVCVPPRLALIATGTDTYSVEGKACGITLRGNAVRSDQVLEFSWKMAPCSGVTNYTLGEDCRSARGPIKIRESLLCKDLGNEGIISFHGRETESRQAADALEDAPANNPARGSDSK